MLPFTCTRYVALSRHLLARSCAGTVPVCALGTSVTRRILPKQKQSSADRRAVNTEPSNFDADSKSAPSESDINFATLDPDKFGDLFEQYSHTSRRGPLKSEEAPDDDDGYDKLEIKRGVKKSIEAYRRMLNELKRQKPPNVAAMLELHRQFIYEDRYEPDKMLYSLLIDAVAQVGFTRKAVELFEEMRRFELKPTKSTVTALFNACANCTHTAQYGLQQASRIREMLQLDGYEFNDIHYNVLIKSFARLGDMATARATMQEMVDKGHSVAHETYAMLLMGCISNKKQGLLEATNLMHQMLLQSGVKKLELPVLNLFLRCIRDCEMSQEDMQKVSSSPLLAANARGQSAQLAAKVMTEHQLTPSDATDKRAPAAVATIDKLPNLLTGANLEQIISIDYASLSRAANRFILFGGVQGFCQLMDSHGITPNLKTVTLFIDLMYARDSLAEVDRLLRRYNLKADVFLYNVLLKKVAKTGKHALCREILAVMQEKQIQPDIMTFGALTFACSEAKQARRLLGDMFKCGIVPNDKIIGSLVNIACSRSNLDYVAFLLEYIERNHLSLSRIDVEQVDLLLKKTKREIASNERKDVPISAEYKRSYELVAHRFGEMLKSSSVEVNTHPWSQFEATPRTSQKAQFNAFVRAMEQKTDIKLRRERKPQVADYNDEIDD